MDPQSLRDAERYARELAALSSAESEEQVRNRIAARFFGEGGVPVHLKQGWAILWENRKKRAEMGYPMPPGGCLTLGPESVIAGALAEMHGALATLLNIPVGAIKMRLERLPSGAIRPLADITEPDGWVVPVAANAPDPQQAVREYVARAIEAVSVQFRQSVSNRLGACQEVRAELLQEVSPFKPPEESDDQDSGQPQPVG